VTLDPRRGYLASGAIPEGQTEIGAQGEPLFCFLPQPVLHYLFYDDPLGKHIVEMMVNRLLLLKDGPGHMVHSLKFVPTA
jgi:hypothetical protein